MVSTARDLSSVHIVRCVVVTDGDVGVLQESKCGVTTEGTLGYDIHIQICDVSTKRNHVVLQGLK